MESAVSLESFPPSAALWRMQSGENFDGMKLYKDGCHAMGKFENGMHIQRLIYLNPSVVHSVAK